MKDGDGCPIPVGSAYGIIKRVAGIFRKIRCKENFFNFRNHILPPLSDIGIGFNFGH
jgi:hypothetical protein